MPQIKNGPKALNELLERVYASCMNEKNNKTTCSKIAWTAAYSAGWYRDKSGKWKKRKVKTKTYGQYVDTLNLLSLS